MKLQLKVLLFFTLTFTLCVSAQNYQKTYQQNISYKTGNKDGKNLTLDFACKYDAFLGEPLFSSRTKVVSESDFVMYKGVKYTRAEIGDEVFNKVEVGLINVSFDIYQGSSKITTVHLENEISVSFIPGSPDWKDLWPGVTEERAKKIWKEGYSIRNAKLYDVKFNGFYALESLLKKRKKEEEDAKKEAEKKKKEEEAKKKEEKEKAKKEAEEKEKKEAEEKQNKEESERQKAEAKLKQEQERKEAEAERKRKEEERKQRIRDEYQQRVSNQNKKNSAIVASTAASGATVLYLLGGVIYSGAGKVKPEHIFKGKNLYLGFDIGYTLTGAPLYFPSEKSGLDADAEYETTYSTKADYSITVNLKTNLKFGYEHEYGGGHIFGTLEGGVSPLLSGSIFNYSYGARVFGGEKNFKAFGEYQMGSRTFTNSDFLDSEENGKGKSKYDYDNVKLGLKFSWYGNKRTAARNHIYIGIIEERIKKIDKEYRVQSIYDSPNSTSADANINKPLIFTKDITYTGYMFEWHHDHNGKLFFEVYPNYPRTGKTGGKFDDSLKDEEDGSLFFQIGYQRSLDSFFNKKN